MWSSDRSFKLWRQRLPYPPFSPLHFSGTPAQHSTGQYSTVLGISQKEVKATDFLRFTVARPRVMWTRVLPEPRYPELEHSPFPPRRPVSFSVSVKSFYRAHTTNAIWYPVQHRSFPRQSVGRGYTPVDNNPTHPELSFRSLLRSGWTVDKETLDF
jgi:hypothetical protein